MVQMKWNKIILTVSLVVTFGLQLMVRQNRPTNYSVMPIFTPVSLDYEAEMRKIREQPIDFNPRPILQHLDYLVVTERLNHSNGVLIEQIQENKERLLRLRHNRHQLNIEMMDFAILLTQKLSKEQWEYIQSSRDLLKAETELGAYERILEQLHNIPD